MKRSAVYLLLLVCGIGLFYYLTETAYSKARRELIDVTFSLGSIAILKTEIVAETLKAIQSGELKPSDIESHRYITNSILIEFISIRTVISTSQKQSVCKFLDSKVVATALDETIRKADLEFAVFGFKSFSQFCRN